MPETLDIGSAVMRNPVGKYHGGGGKGSKIIGRLRPQIRYMECVVAGMGKVRSLVGRWGDREGVAAGASNGRRGQLPYYPWSAHA